MLFPLPQDTSAGLTNEVRDMSQTKLIEDFDYCTTSKAASLSIMSPSTSSVGHLLSLALLFLLSRL
jgi:hypothetical protein